MNLKYQIRFGGTVNIITNHRPIESIIPSTQINLIHTDRKVAFTKAHKGGHPGMNSLKHPPIIFGSQHVMVYLKEQPQKSP